MKLTENQEDILVDLYQDTEEGESPRWVRPLDIGGRDGSHHSSTLRQLERKGLVESKKRSSGYRDSRLYRISEEGHKLCKRKSQL